MGSSGNLIDALRRYCDEWGLEVNVPKTEYLHAKKGDRSGLGELRYGHKVLSVCTQFKYVGVWFASDCTFDVHFVKFAERARRAMYACHGKALRLDKDCPVALRCMLFRVYVYPLLIYACDALPVPTSYV